MDALVILSLAVERAATGKPGALNEKRRTTNADQPA